MAQIYSTIPEDERLDRSCSIDVDVIDKKTGRRAIIALAALAFAAGALVSTKARGATNLAAAVAPHRGTKHWTCEAPFLDTTLYGPSSGELSAADLYVELSNGIRLPENGIMRFQAGQEESITATLKSSAGSSMSRVSAWAFAGNMGDYPSAPAPTGPAGITFAAPPTDPYEGFATDRPKDGCWVGLWQAGPTVNARSGQRGSSLPASVEYTAPTFSFKTYAEKSATVTAFIDEKWYQSTFKLAICTAGC
jgi:hypothetical protein